MSRKAFNFFYRIVKREGVDCLERVSFDTVTAEVAASMHAVVSGFTQREDRDVLSRIAAGTAVRRIFEAKTYKSTGQTKAGYCRQIFRRSPRTIDSYVAAAECYEDIGGIECAAQPDSVNQLEALGLVRREARSELWLRLAAANGGKPPSGEALERHALLENLVASKRVAKPREAKLLDLPCATLEEAVEFASAQLDAKPNDRAWQAMLNFLRSHAQQNAPKISSRARRRSAGPAPDIPGQSMLFAESYTPTTHEITDAPAIPQLG